MKTLTSKNAIRLHFVGLQQKERLVFDRVVSFNKDYGLKIQVCNDLSLANLVVAVEAAFTQLGNDQTVLVITKDLSFGDVQVASPLLITRVMKALGAAIKIVDEKPTVVENQSASKSPSQSVSGKTAKPSVSKTNGEDYNKKTNKETNKETPDTGRFHALVIDDSMAIRKHLELELRDSGVSADFAESGEQALEKIKERLFDLIFLDIMMPGIDGYETCKLIRANPAFKKTPIIMLSGKTSPLDEVQGIIAGASTYLTKPVKSDKLQAVLGRVTNWISEFNSTQEAKLNDPEKASTIN